MKKNYDVEVRVIGKETVIEKREMKFAIGEQVVFCAREGARQKGVDAILELVGKKFEVVGAYVCEHTLNKKIICAEYYETKAIDYIPYTHNLKSQSYSNFNNGIMTFLDIELDYIKQQKTA